MNTPARPHESGAGGRMATNENPRTPLGFLDPVFTL